MKNTAKSEDKPAYTVNKFDDDTVIDTALKIIQNRLTIPTETFLGPENVGAYCCIQARELEREVFSVLFLNSQNQLISFETMFLGTLTCAAVYPREIAKKALQLNAANVILTHNHPSGSITPSMADTSLTTQIKTALALVDINVLDHIVTSGGKYTSMAAVGYI
jgi:DNA repair protein RadC